MSEGVGGWTEYDIHDLAQLLLARLLHSHGFQLSKAVAIAESEMLVGALVFHASLQRGTIIDESTAGILKKNPSHLNKAAMKLADRKNRGAVSGYLFIWGDGIEPNTYTSPEHAKAEARRTHGDEVHLVTWQTVDLREVGRLLVDRIGGLIGIITDQKKSLREGVMS
jgi:hypothetical protein